VPSDPGWTASPICSGLICGRHTDDLIARFSETAGDGFVTMHEATRKLGVSRQTVLQRVKRGELEVVHVTKGRKKGIRIKVITRQSELFDQIS
jgi:biotin operon repressor